MLWLRSKKTQRALKKANQTYYKSHRHEPTVLAMTTLIVFGGPVLLTMAAVSWARRLMEQP